MIWLLVVAAAAGVVVLVAVRVNRGTWSLPDLGDPVTSTPGPLPLPADVAATTVADIEALRFDRAPRGYDLNEVDDRLDAIAQVLEERATPNPSRAPDGRGLADLAAQPLRVQVFGYRMDQVDAVLDRWAPPAATHAGPSHASDRPQAEGDDDAEGDPELSSPPVLPSPHDPAAHAPDPTDPDPAIAQSTDPDLADAHATETDSATAGPSHAEATDLHLPVPVSHRHLANAVAVALYAGGAAFLLRGLIADPAGVYLSQGVQDQQAFEWYFGATWHNLATLSNPLFTNLQNYPEGVNLMANAAVMGLGAPLAPVTWLAGPHVTFVLIEWLGFTLTALAWYVLFVRRLPASPWTAIIGGALCGFSPAMVSHGNGHPNFIAQFLVPVLIDRVIALQDAPRRWLRGGVVLGLLAVWQLWMGEEVLLLAAVGVGLLGLVLAAHGQIRWRALLPGAGVAIAVVVALFAVPLWWQFFGPQSYREIWSPPGGNDLAALWGRATRSVGADPWESAALSMNRTEENAFFGIPLWFVAGAAVVLLWRKPLVQGLAVVIVVTCWLSLGPQVLLHGIPVSLPAPWQLLDNAPLVGNVLPSRFTMVAVPAFAALLVLLLEEARRRWPALALPAAAIAVAVAVLPMVPTPLIVNPRPTVPAFFTDGAWTDYVDGGSVLAVPPPDIVDMRAVDWQAAADYRFPLVEGYFLGPDASGSGQGQRGSTRRPLSLWLASVVQTGTAHVATSDDRGIFLADLRAWRTDVIVLPQGRELEGPLLASLTSAFGVPTARDGVWLWDARRLRSAG